MAVCITRRMRKQKVNTYHHTALQMKCYFKRLTIKILQEVVFQAEISPRYKRHYTNKRAMKKM